LSQSSREFSVLHKARDLPRSISVVLKVRAVALLGACAGSLRFLGSGQAMRVLTDSQLLAF
jgi:hypothetical protein